MRELAREMQRNWHQPGNGRGGRPASGGNNQQHQHVQRNGTSGENSGHVHKPTHPKHVDQHFFQHHQNPHRQQMTEISGAEEHLKKAAQAMEIEMMNLWGAAANLPYSRHTDVSAIPKAKQLTIEKGSWKDELQHNVESHIKKYVAEKNDGLIPTSDPHYAGNCHTASYHGFVKGDGSFKGRMQFTCNSVIVACKQGQMAFTMVHTSNEKDKLAANDKLIFHLYHLDNEKGSIVSQFYDSTDPNTPNAILIPSTCTSMSDVKSISNPKDHLFDYIFDMSLVSMVFLRKFKPLCTLEQFKPLHGSRVMSIYAVKSKEDGAISFLLCRSRDLVAQKSMMHKIDLVAQKLLMHKVEDKQFVYPKVIPMWERFTESKIQQAISSATQMAKQQVKPALDAYILATKIYKSKQTELSKVHALLISDGVKKYDKYLQLQQLSNRVPVDGMLMHQYENDCSIKSVQVPKHLYWTYRVQTNTMHEKFAIDFDLQDDFSHEAPFENKIQNIASHALHHCLSHRNGSSLHKHASEKWDVDAIHEALDAVELPGGMQDIEDGDRKAGVSFSRDGCTVTVSKKAVVINSATCQKLERQEKTTLAVNPICKDKPYEIKVEFHGDGIDMRGFTVVVHIAMANRPVCREDAVTEMEGKKVGKPVKLHENKNQYVYVRPLEGKTRHSVPSYTSIGMRQVMGRVAEMQTAALHKEEIDASLASVMWCNASIAHVHHVS